MKQELKQTFDKPASTVIKMFGDRQYFERKYAELGFKNVQVLEHDKKGDQFTIRVRYTAKADVALPDFAKKFVPAEMTITQRDSWDMAKKVGQLEVELAGLPLKVGAAMRLVDSGKGSTNTIAWEIKCSVPLVGGKLEKLLMSDIEAKADADLAASRKILADY
ncbi:DUF2505 domain-containing protein [Solimonas marina]|uniref:DUF2505 domain-containing protein n=1 Tax=Solimonas marina TaxID=2714601 RepID=A0A969WAV1_9GAMM|nr:DUF2505 domain-containing protein [Solimonas marina]NKF23792.1 DUF2505 domain-containing protein [Solimonas marina]